MVGEHQGQQDKSACRGQGQPLDSWPARCVKSIGRGLSELRLRFGAGLRVYFYQDRDTLVVLLKETLIES